MRAVLLYGLNRMLCIPKRIDHRSFRIIVGDDKVCDKPGPSNPGKGIQPALLPTTRGTEAYWTLSSYSPIVRVSSESQPVPRPQTKQFGLLDSDLVINTCK